MRFWKLGLCHILLKVICIAFGLSHKKWEFIKLYNDLNYSKKKLRLLSFLTCCEKHHSIQRDCTWVLQTKYYENAIEFTLKLLPFSI